MLKEVQRSERERQEQEGSVAIELAIVLPVFLLLSVVVADMSHGWYLKQLVISASREGARYGVQYPPVGSGRARPASTFVPSISDWITSSSYADYGSRLPSLNVSVSGAGYTGMTPGLDLTVTVTSVKTWWVAGSLIPGLGSSLNLSNSTTMYLE